MTRQIVPIDGEPPGRRGGDSTRLRHSAAADSRGIALVVTMMVMLMLIALTGALVPLASTETSIGANHRRALQAFYAAEAGVEWAVQELRETADWDDLLTGRARSSLTGPTRWTFPDGASLDLSAHTVRLERTNAPELRWGLFAHVPLRRLLPQDPSNGLLFVAVWLAKDRDDPDDSDDPDAATEAATEGQLGGKDAGAGDGDDRSDVSDSLIVHVAVFGPGLAERAVRGTVIRRGSGTVVLTSWRLVQ
jgi:hypothetical protein